MVAPPKGSPQTRTQPSTALPLGKVVAIGVALAIAALRERRVDEPRNNGNSRRYRRISLLLNNEVQCDTACFYD